MIRITTTGPESCGKTTLANWLAQRLSKSMLLPEYARIYLSNHQGEYSSQDLVHFAEQLELSLARQEDASCVIADTDFYVLEIWWREKFPHLTNPISYFTSRNPFDVYFLCKPDLKWEPDPLRENPYDRERLFDLYELALTQDRRPYVVVAGEGEERFHQAEEVIQQRFPFLVGPK